MRALPFAVVALLSLIQPAPAQDLPLPSAEAPFDLQATRQSMRTLSREERAAYRAELRDRLEQLPEDQRQQVQAFLDDGGRGPILQLFDDLPAAERVAALQRLQELDGAERRDFLIETFGAERVRAAVQAQTGRTVAEGQGTADGVEGATAQGNAMRDQIRTLVQSLSEEERAELQAMSQQERRAFIRERLMSEGAGLGGGGAANGERGALYQRLMGQLSEEDRAQLQGMSPEERRAFLRERLGGQGGALGGGSRGRLREILGSLSEEERAQLRDMSRQERRAFIRDRMMQSGGLGRNSLGGSLGGNELPPGRDEASTGAGATPAGRDPSAQDGDDPMERIIAVWPTLPEPAREQVVQRIQQSLTQRLDQVPEAAREMARQRIEERLILRLPADLLDRVLAGL